MVESTDLIQVDKMKAKKLWDLYFFMIKGQRSLIQRPLNSPTVIKQLQLVVASITVSN